MLLETAFHNGDPNHMGFEDADPGLCWGGLSSECGD
jgi:hypothetical protein